MKTLKVVHIPSPTPPKKNIWFRIFWAPSCTWIPGILIPTFWWERDEKSHRLSSQILWSVCGSFPCLKPCPENSLERRKRNLETVRQRGWESVLPGENAALMKSTAWHRTCFGRRWAVGVSEILEERATSMEGISGRHQSLQSPLIWEVSFLSLSKFFRWVYKMNFISSN